MENVVDRVDTLGTVFLGLTVSCARCHDHKYDPISQREYYELFAQFNNVPEWGVGPNNGNSPPYITVPKNWPNISPEEDRLITPPPLDFIKSDATMRRPLPGGVDTVMVMAELPEPRPTHLLRRGVYNDPDTSEILAPAAPRSLLAEGVAPPRNRLELAQFKPGLAQQRHHAGDQRRRRGTAALALVQALLPGAEGVMPAHAQ